MAETAPVSESHASPNWSLIDAMVRQHRQGVAPRLARLWDYYRNPARHDVPGADAAGRARQLAQARGLPARLVSRSPGEDAHAGPKELVVENDIAWRIHCLVDFMFGKPIHLRSRCGDDQRARQIEAFLDAVFAANGGPELLQNLALLGAVYGYVDVQVTADAAPIRAGADDAPQRHAHRISLSVLDPPNVIALLNPNDYRQLDAYLLHYTMTLNALDRSPTFHRLRQWLGGGAATGGRQRIDRTEVWTAEEHRVYAHRDGKPTLLERSPNALGRIPIVHIQNLPQPFFYEGLSEVEPLIALQDELNTRLSDRANRVTFQSFKMYLGKGIEQFADRPIGPGQMWSTDNLDAAIEEFGGDADSPSELAHIAEIREAMDKTSGVSPVAAGVLRDRVGNLTSENALRVVLMGLLAKTERKRVTYGEGITQLCTLILQAAHVHGLFATTPEERAVEIDWPSMLPENQTQRLEDAQRKLEIGIDREQVLAELGYRH